MSEAFTIGGGSEDVAINAQTGTSYTLVLSDARKVVTMDNGAASTWTVPPNADVAFPLGSEVAGIQLGAGVVTITPGSGVTLQSVGGLLEASAQYASWCILKIATNTWIVTGQLA